MGANGASGYNLENSLRFRSSASAYLSRTPATAGNRKTFTISMWVKRGILGTNNAISLLEAWNGASSDYFAVGFTASDNFRMYNLVSNSYTLHIASNATYRDPSSWYHIVVAVDTTQATSTNRVKVYINGEQVTSLSTTVYPSLNADMWVNNNILHKIARNDDYAGNFDGYLTEINLIDGQALTPSDFGETNSDTGVWQPKEYTGTYGTNGFYLPFKPTTQATGFNTVLYAGNGGTQSISNVGFTPDLVWIKNRSFANSHQLVDSVRGATKHLFSNTTDQEYTYANGLTSFNTDGFSIGNLNDVNNASYNYVGWCWDAGSGSPVSNTDGTITSTIKANPATGFSVVTYTGNGTSGATTGHGLSTAPQMVIFKNRDVVGQWNIIAPSVLGAGYWMPFTTAASAFFDSNWTTTSSLLSLGSGGGHNGSGNGIVAYCFSDVAGYQKIGSYTGNGSTSGPTITTGFRPRFVMIKRTDVAQNWTMIDTARDANYNNANKRLFANLASAEDLGIPNFLELLSNGFKCLDSNISYNASGGTYIYLAIADTTDAQFNFDASGNKNNWEASNINSNASGDTTYDIMSDVPTLTDEDTANYAVLNPLGITGATLSNANLTVVGGNTAWTDTIELPLSGKWYVECTASRLFTNIYGAGYMGIFGIAPTATAGVPGTGAGTGYTTGTFMNANAQGSYGTYKNGVYTQTVSGAVLNGVMAFAYDADANTMQFYLNNVAYGSLLTGVNSVPMMVYGFTNGTSTADSTRHEVNFGQRPFAYTPPTGYLKLNTFNLPDSSIVDGSEYFNTVLYTGNGSTQSITSLDFGPDLTWIKVRNSASYEQMWFDSVRGATKYVRSNSTAAEGTVANSLTSFDSNGFSLGANGDVNGSTFPIVAWNWKAGGTAVSNTDGTITSSVSANTTAGFSIVTYTGTGSAATVGHGLGVAPGMVIAKSRNNTGGDSGIWVVYHRSLTSAAYFLYLNQTSAQTAASTVWNSTSPTSSVFSIGSASGSGTASNHVAYCFADVEGYSKFGSYTGNGSTDGPFVYTGFKPAYVLIKRADAVGTWWIHDAARNTYNVVDNYLFAESSAAEATYANMDFTSNGFKLRLATYQPNASGGSYIYMAFAENPFKNSLAR